jgi:hypothetical protein
MRGEGRVEELIKDHYMCARTVLTEVDILNNI